MGNSIHSVLLFNTCPFFAPVVIQISYYLSQVNIATLTSHLSCPMHFVPVFPSREENRSTSSD